MREYLRKIGEKAKKSDFKSFLVKKVKQLNKRNFLTLGILAISAGLFFSVFWGEKASAERKSQVKTMTLSQLDPMERIGKGFIKEKELEEKEKPEEKQRKEKYKKMIAGFPMEKMLDSISQKNQEVAAFLIGIGKKESNWGKHSPKKDGQDCFNYWGYKGGYKATVSGYSCFDSPEQAIEVVGGRIEKLISQKINTPERMIVWKCGSSCLGHDPASVKKWIADVSQYYYKLKS